MKKYSYEPLNHDRPVIRLLHLHPGGNNDEISCSVSQAELNQRNDTISYEALSYTWGFPDLYERIIVDGCYLKVTYNLHSVLQQLRYSDVDRTLWIDAICIDQENKKERGHQVEQMSKIYSEAERVIFWLGPGTIETDVLMESLRLLQRKSIRRNLGNLSLQDDRWKHLWASMELTFIRSHKHFRAFQCRGLRELLARPWFRRVWILQEVALAKAGIIMCGRKSESARLFGLIPLFLEIKPDSHCQSVLDIMPSPWRKTSWWSKSPNLRTLLVNFGDSKATESRDLVYALRGMSSDAAEKNGIIPDYDKREEDLVREVAQFVEHCEPEHLVLTTPPRTIPDLIKCLKALDLRRCMHFTKNLMPRDLEKLLEKTKVSVNQEIFTTAVACDDTGEVVDILLPFCQEGFIHSNTVLLAAAKNTNGAKGIFEALLRHERGQIYFSDEVLVAAAGNRICGSEIFEALLRYQRDQINVSDNVLIMAMDNERCSNVILEALFRYRGDQIKISDEVLIEAVENERCGNVLFKALSYYQGDQIEITTEVLKAAARNGRYGDVMFEAIFGYRRNQTEISDKALETATRSISTDDTTSTSSLSPKRPRLFKWYPLEYESTALLQVAAANIRCGDRIINILLSHHPDLAEFSEDIAIAAAKNWGCGDRVMDTLLYYRNDLVIFSEEVVIAAASNIGCGDGVMQTILSHHPRSVIISQGAVIAAANNKICGHKVIQTYRKFLGN